jgi:ankyrin repeat protein
LIIMLLRDIGENLPHAIDKPLLHEAIIGNGYQGTSNTVMQFLLERGCDINELYHDKTPLQTAIHHYQEGAFDFLLNHNADLKLQNSHGDTALHVALRKAIFAPHIIDMSYRLINEGADLFIENERGECPFDIIMLNSTLRDQMLATYGEAFINEQVKIRNCLGIFLSSEEIQAQMINDPFFGEAGLNWFKGQIKNGTQIAEGCLARLVAHDDTFGKFINDRLGTPYFDFIQNNMPSLLARFEVLQTPAPEVTRARFN